MGGKKGGKMGGIRGAQNRVNVTIALFKAFLPPPLSFFPSPLVRLRGLLAAERQFAVVLPEAERMARLGRRLARVVPAAVARACTIAAIQHETAIIFCASGAIASRVRAQMKSVVQALNTDDMPVTALRIKVRADWALPEKAEKHDLPGAALRAFAGLDAELPEGGLKQAVERLLSRRSGRS